MRILRGQSNLEVSSKGFALFVVGLVCATFFGGALRTVLSSDQVHQRIVTELKNRFPKHEFQVGQTEVLLSRGIWPGFGLRVHDLVFKQDVCGKLSFLLSVPQAMLPLDILSLRHGKIRLNDVEITDGTLQLDYRDCAVKAAEAAVGPTHATTAPDPIASPKSIAAPKFNWQPIAQVLDGITLKNFAITYHKNPTWKLVFNSAYFAFGRELTARAKAEIEKSLPFGTLSHPVDFDLHGEKDILRWNFGADFKEGHVRLNGGLDTGSQAASLKVEILQVPIKDFMSELYQMGFVDQDLKLKATWLSCAVQWEGQLQNYAANPAHVRECRVEGGYGRAELAQADLWFGGGEYFHEPALFKIEQFALQPVAEALNRQVLPAVLSKLGVWTGKLQFQSPKVWRLDGALENFEIVFSNQSMHGKQTIDRLHTIVDRSPGLLTGSIDEMSVRDGTFAGLVKFTLTDNGRDGKFDARIENLKVSPSIQNLLVGGTIGPLSGEGHGAIVGGELTQWEGDFKIPDLDGEGWHARGIQMKSKYKLGIFHLEGVIQTADINNSWRFSPQLRGLGLELPEQVSWRDLTANLEIERPGGVIRAVTATEIPANRTWRGKGLWARDGELNGTMEIGQAKKFLAFGLHGEKGILQVRGELGSSK